MSATTPPISTILKRPKRDQATISRSLERTLEIQTRSSTKSENECVTDCNSDFFTIFAYNQNSVDMIDWSKITDTSKYVVDGDDAKRVYDILQMSYFGKNKKLPTSLLPDTSKYNYKLEYKYEDGVLYIEERVSGCSGGFIINELLFFLVPHDNIYILSERCNDGVPWSYSIKDDEGKYFVRPPKTEYELQQEAEARRFEGDTTDLPF